MAAPMRKDETRQKTNSKRKASGKLDRTASEKRPRGNSFDDLEFKYHLKAPNTVFIGFEKFIEAARNWTDGAGEDIVLKYCRSSPECSEIFQVLEAGSRKVHELQLVFTCLEKILLRIADDLGQFYTTGQNIVKKLLAGHVHAIFNTLNVKNKSNQIKASLKLLVAMVMIGVPSAKLVLNNVDLGHTSMLPLLQRRDVKDEEDVRTCFIHLVLACLLAGDNDVIRKLVQTKGLMESLFQGVEFDRVATLQLLLSTILEKVIMNSGISKTTKAHMFSEKGLKELGRLYDWQGLAKWKQTLKQKGKQPVTPFVETEDSENEDKRLVAELADKFLTEVCTSYKHGIIFHDKTYGLSGRSQNHLMTRFLGYLSGRLSHVLVQKLVIGILTACPDQLQYFLPHITDSLVPRETAKWINTMNFLMKVYSSLGKDMSVLKTKDKKSVGNFVQILMVYTMPSSQILNTVLAGVRDKLLVVNHVSLGLVRQIADTAVHVLKLLHNLHIYTQEERLEIHNLYIAYVLKNLPHVTDVFNCWDKVMSTQKSTLEEMTKLQDLCGVGYCDVLIQIEQILCLYQDLQHDLLAEHPLILGKLIEGIMGTEWGTVSDETGHMTKVYLLKLMAGTESRRLPWAKQNASGHTLLYQLLDLLTQLSSNTDLADVTLQLVCKLLESTGQFEDHHDDLLVWLKALQSSDTSILDFVSKVMMTYIHNPYPYMDKMCDLDLQTDAALVTKLEVKQQLGVNEIIAMDAVNLEEDSCEHSSHANKRFPFCPVLIVGLDMLEKLDIVSKEIRCYISKVLLSTFHQQVEPVAMCTLLTKYKASLFLPGLSDYIRTWIQTDVTDSETLSTKSSYENFLSQNEAIITEDASPRCRIQQDLLHLLYIIQQCRQHADKRYVKHIKTLKKSIISSIKEISEDQETSQKEVCDQTVHELLDKRDENVLYLSVRSVLDHPVCKQFFLLDASDKQSTRIANTVTDLVTELFEVTFEQNLQLEGTLDYYYQRIISALQSVKRELIGHSVFKVLTVFVLKCTADQCRQMLDLVLNAFPDEDEADDSLLVPLFENLIQRLINSDFTVAKLTENGLYTLINCFVNGKKSTDLLCRFFKRFPVLSAQCSERTVEKLFLFSEHARLVQFFMENNAVVKVTVGKMIQSADQDWTTTENVKIVIKYIRLVLAEQGKCGQRIPAAETVLNMFTSQLLSLCGGDVVKNASDLLELAELLTGSDLLGEKLISKMKKKLAVTLAQETMKPHHIDLLCMVYSVDNKEKLVPICIKCLIAVYSTVDVDKICRSDIEDKLLDILAGCTQNDFETLAAMSELQDCWPKLVESTLRFAFTKPQSLKFNVSLLQSVYQQSDIELGVSMENISAIVMSHSSLLPVMFGEHGQECKDLLVSLILVLTELCPTSCHSDHIGVFLGAYRASLSLTDQKILKLMHLYEKHEISFSDYKPFLWGEKAVEQHTLRESLGPSLKQATMMQVMSNIDANMMSQSVLHFPLSKKLHDMEPQPAEEYKSHSQCYNPCFILPLFSHILQPESVIDCRRFIQSGCLGYTLASLSSHDENIRNVAQHILDKFQGHLEAARIPEKDQLLYMLHVIKSSIPKTKNKLSSIITQFLARTAKLMLKPGDHMYTIINQFLLRKPTLDVGNIPEFFKLFNSSAMQYQMERSWMLTLMKDGLREAADYWIFEKRFTFKLLQSFYDSRMADLQSQVQVIQILLSACKERRLAVDLCQNHGFLVWIAAAICKLSCDKVQLCISLCDLLHQVWTSVMKHSQDNKQSIQLSFSVQILACLKTLLLYLRNIPVDVKVQCLLDLSFKC
ncbi:nucleolar pre-ribosomal-associated protein 1-like isoform X2 [Mercenaria mercenaria]|uniref:nucleolar pre-ribosomal-associated protein 1-like isoform X2 n=1 Tax=Mercenaria mercenaria TaxID=6596 RepID=UPI00234F1BAB|nr:nucleolar pre-ribosomal-associated protein 1-like isoform X2 [Mercenaria mercenaria]